MLKDPEKKPKKKKPCLVIFLIFLILVLGGMGFFYYKYHNTLMHAFSLVSKEQQTKKLTVNTSVSINGSIYFVKNRDIWKFSQSSLTQVTHSANIDEASVSENGQSIIYAQLNGDNSDLFLLNQSSGQTTKLTKGSVSSDLYANLWNLDPAFSPDGTEVSYLSDRGKFTSGVSDLSIYTMNLHTKIPIQLAQGNPYTGGNEDPAFYPLDANYIIYDAFIYTENQSQPFSKLMLMNRTSKQTYELSPDYSGVMQASFSPDGKYIIFTQRDYAPNAVNPNLNTYIMPFSLANIQSTNPVDSFLNAYNEKTLIHSGLDAMPVFSPNGQSAAFITLDDTSFDLAIISLTYRNNPDGSTNIKAGKEELLTTNANITSTSRISWSTN